MKTRFLGLGNACLTMLALILLGFTAIYIRQCSHMAEYDRVLNSASRPAGDSRQTTGPKPFEAIRRLGKQPVHDAIEIRDVAE